MALLAPLFLVGLLALAVPVLVHLTHRQRREPVAFPSLMFLRRIEFKTTRRQRLRDRLLFALRAIALALLALAFARPFLRARDAAPAEGRAGRDVVILLDHSFSMGYGDRWARARAAALRTIDGLGAADRATVVRFAARAEALNEPTADRGVLRAAVEGIRPGSAATRYAPALSLARSLTTAGERPRREVVLISDFQRAGWTAGEELRLPDGTALSTVDVGEGESENVAVTDVDFRRAVDGGRERVTATARVANRGPRVADGVPVTLVLDGREVARETVRLDANGAASVRLGPFVLPDTVARGAVRAGSDALPGDNVRHFTLGRGGTIAVLIVQDPTAPPGRTLYLRRALALGGDPAFRVDVHRGDAPAAADLAGRALVILDDATPARGEPARRLRDFVRAGGGLVATFGERARPEAWPAELAELLPARVGETVDRAAERGGRLGALDRSHPVLAPFAAPRSGTFTAAHFFRYRPLAPGDSAAVIARFDDGSAALAERRVGRGRVLAWASTLDNVWNDLPLQPVFLPFVHQLAKYAAGWSEERPWRTVGDALDAGALPGAQSADSATAEYVALSPAGERARLTARTAALELTTPGIWEVRRFNTRDSPTRLVAVNVDVAESDLARVTPAEVVAAVAPRAGGPMAAGAAAATLTEAERESRQSLWWFLLLVAAVLLTAETVLSNRLRGAVR
jgi:hypothetical protein